MKLIKWIKRIFTPVKWETIWTETMDAKMSDSSKIKMAVIIKVDYLRNKFQCYATNGFGYERNIDINWLITQYPEIVVILDKYNLKY